VTAAGGAARRGRRFLAAGLLRGGWCPLCRGRSQGQVGASGSQRILPLAEFAGVGGGARRAARARGCGSAGRSWGAGQRRRRACRAPAPTLSWRKATSAVAGGSFLLLLHVHSYAYTRCGARCMPCEAPALDDLQPRALGHVLHKLPFELVLKCLQFNAALCLTDSASLILAACKLHATYRRTTGPASRTSRLQRAASACAHATALLQRPPAAALGTGRRAAARTSHFSTCARAEWTHPADACCPPACFEQWACKQQRMAQPSSTACAVLHVDCHCCQHTTWRNEARTSGDSLVHRVHGVARGPRLGNLRRPVWRRAVRWVLFPQRQPVCAHCIRPQLTTSAIFQRFLDWATASLAFLSTC